MTSYATPPSFDQLEMYPLVKEFKEIISRSMYEQYGEDRAIDVLDAPIETLTNLPYLLLNYLYERSGTIVSKKHLVMYAVQLNYEKYHADRAVEEYLVEHPNVSSFWDKDKRQLSLVWLGLSENECQQRLQDTEWFEGLPDTPTSQVFRTEVVCDRCGTADKGEGWYTHWKRYHKEGKLLCEKCYRNSNTTST